MNESASGGGTATGLRAILSLTTICSSALKIAALYFYCVFARKYTDSGSRVIALVLRASEPWVQRGPRNIVCIPSTWENPKSMWPI